MPNVLPLRQRTSYDSGLSSEQEVPDTFKPRSPLQDLKKFRDSEKGSAVVAWVKQAVSQAKTDRGPHREQWLTNYAFYRNRQRLSKFSGLSEQAQAQLNNATKKAQRMINRVQPMVRTELAALTAQRPSAVVVPATSEDNDLFAAQAAEALYEHVYTRLDMEYYQGIAAMWQVVAGNGFIKVWWDPAKKDKDSGVNGDFDACAPPPFQIFVPDLLEPDIQKQGWVAHCFVKPVEEVKATYRDQLEGKLKDLQPSQHISRTEIDSGVSEVDRTKAAPTGVQVIEMWIKPNASPYFPEGGLVTLVEDILVQVKESFPYNSGNFPFYHFKHIETGTFYAESPVTPIIELQQDYNKFRGQVRESINKVSRLQIMAPKGSIVGSKWTNQTGLLVEYQPGFAPPQPFPVQELPGYLQNEMQQILMDIEDITGQHQVTKGQAPGQGVTAATAISYLQEKDDAYRTPAYRSIEKGFRDFGRDVIQHAIQFWQEPRLIKIVGADSAFDTLVLTGSKLANSTDLRMEAGSSLPTSKAARQAFIMDLMSQGFIPPEEGLKLMEMGGTNAVVDKLRVDERQAQRENIKLKSLTPEDIAMFNEAWERNQPIGQDTQQPMSPPPVVTVNDWDNHKVHIMVHNNFRKSQEFEQLPDEVKALFQAHVQMHEQVMMQSQIQQFMDMIPGDGSESGEMDLGQFGEENPDEMGGNEMPPTDDIQEALF